MRKMKTLKKFGKVFDKATHERLPYYGRFSFQRKSACVLRTSLREVIRDFTWGRAWRALWKRQDDGS